MLSKTPRVFLALFVLVAAQDFGAGRPFVKSHHARIY